MKRFKDWMFAAIVVVGIGVFAFSGRTEATDAEYQLDVEPEIIAATFSSAWCSSCKILEPRLAKVIPEFSDKPVKFVEFDFTFGQRAEIADQAAAVGLSTIYPQFKGATGFTVLVDAQSEEIIDILTINHSSKAMRAAIAQSIALASAESQSAP